MNLGVVNLYIYKKMYYFLVNLNPDKNEQSSWVCKIMSQFIITDRYVCLYDYTKDTNYPQSTRELLIYKCVLMDVP